MLRSDLRAMNPTSHFCSILAAFRPGLEPEFQPSQGCVLSSWTTRTIAFSAGVEPAPIRLEGGCPSNRASRTCLFRRAEALLVVGSESRLLTSTPATCAPAPPTWSVAVLALSSSLRGASSWRAPGIRAGRRTREGSRTSTKVTARSTPVEESRRGFALTCDGAETRRPPPRASRVKRHRAQFVDKGRRTRCARRSE